MRERLSIVYKKIIKDFYDSYEPHYYLRHDVPHHYRKNEKGKYELIPSKAGINLFFANVSRGVPPERVNDTYNGNIVLSPEEMNDQRYHEPKEVVLQYILNGVRHPETDYRGEMTFISTYSDEDVTVTGTPIEVLTTVANALKTKLTEEAKDAAKQQLHFKYITFD